MENRMSKNTSPNKSSETVQSTVVASETLETAITSFWLLNAGTAKKLGQRSTGILSYHVLADKDRRDLLIAVTRNEGGGYFSRERVPFRIIVTCLEKYISGVPFTSKVLKDVFLSKSANNAGFMAAVLHALGLLAAAPEAKTHHVITGDWSAWEEAMLGETGKLIELPSEIDRETPVESNASPDHKEHKKTLGIPANKPH
jgi:hypothetical protein